MHDLHGAVLAAGLGTRLRPLTHLLPKPLVPVGGRPLVEFALDALASAGIATVGINLWHLGDALRAGLAHRPERLVFVPEETLQGTGGGLRGIAAALPEGPIVAINGDALFGFDLAPVIAAHRAAGAVATLALREVPPDSPFGRVGVDAEGQVHRIAEVEGPGAAGRSLRYGAYTGVQVVERSIIEAIPEGPCDILRSAYRRRMDEGHRVHGHFVPEDALWLDVGTVDRYVDANVAVLEGRLPSGAALPAAGTGGARIHPTARVAADAVVVGPSVVLAGAVIGAGARIGAGTLVDVGARVEPGADLERCVVWRGAVARGRLRDEVVLPEAALSPARSAPGSR